MLITFLKDTEVEGILYHAGESMKLNSEICRQLIESGNARAVKEAFTEKAKKSK